MAREQSGICAETNLHSQYLLFNCNEGVEPAIRAQLSEINAYLEDMVDEYSDIALSGFIAIGVNYWSVLYPNQRPKLLRPFPSLSHDDRHAPVFPLDLFIQIRCDRVDINYLVSREVCLMLEDLAVLVEDIKGFRYLDNRDLTGFVDGTENPKGLNRQAVALVTEQDHEFRGGSYIHIQRYRHDLTAWDKLKTKSQEDVIGRTKQQNHEYSSFNKPKTSHIRRVALRDESGNPMEILRQSMPYGNMKEQGLFFIACCKTPLHFEKMLSSMIVGDHHGHYDHLLNYTQAVTGAAFFAPAANFFTANTSIK